MLLLQGPDLALVVLYVSTDTNTALAHTVCMYGECQPTLVVVVCYIIYCLVKHSVSQLHIICIKFAHRKLLSAPTCDSGKIIYFNYV